MFFNYDLIFNIPLLIGLILYTYGVFFWVLKLRNRLIQAFYLLFVTAMLIYSGVGGSLEGVYPEYYLYYCIYMGVFSVCSFLFINKKEVDDNKDFDDLVTDFFDQISTPVIGLYFLISAAFLFYPEVIVNRLLSPPKPNIESAFAMFINPDEAQDSISTLFTFIKNLLFPFFIISLYKYRHHPAKLAFFWFVPIYFAYCSNSYLGRSEMATSLFTYIAVVFCWNKPYRKMIVIASLFLLVIALPLLAIYQEMRSGAAIGDLTIEESFNFLATIELTFPHFFDQILQYADQGVNHIFEYIQYLIMMVVPSFLRFGFGDMKVNYMITALITGAGDASDITWVILTGIVSESVFLFGTAFFWLHAVILSFIFSWSLNYFSKSDQFRMFLIFCVTSISPFVARGGTAGTIPLLIKGVVYLMISIGIYRFIIFTNAKHGFKQISNTHCHEEQT